jgi:hypothetical protein
MADISENSYFFSRKNVMFVRSIGCNLLVPGQGKYRQSVNHQLPHGQKSPTICSSPTCAVTAQFVLTPKVG